jgi:hypothetical protein
MAPQVVRLYSQMPEPKRDRDGRMRDGSFKQGL